MRHHNAMLAFIAVCTLPGVPAYADSPAPQPAVQQGILTKARRTELYHEAKLDPKTAVTRSLVLPGWGNIYSDKVFKGMLFMGVAGMSLATCLGGILREDKVFTYGGGAVFVSVYTAAAVTSYYDARAYNDNLKLRYKVNLAPSFGPHYKGLALSLRF